jgi:hypothetical protein
MQHYVPQIVYRIHELMVPTVLQDNHANWSSLLNGLNCLICGIVLRPACHSPHFKY